MSDEIEFLEAVEKFGRQLLEERPELEDLIWRAKDGQVDPQEVVKEVWKAAAQRPEIAEALESSLFKAFGVDQGSTDIAHFPDREKMLERWGFTDEDLIFQPFEDRPGYQMLHPLLMGMIVEVLQFDGDVPELRTGRLPEGGTPAVPVKTTARDPVAVGAMLRRASEEVAFELGAARGEHQSKLAEMVDVVGGTGEAVTGIVRHETERGISVPGYGPGQKAQIREVEAPTARDLARMPFAERQELAHKTLSSTQGRRSAVPVISDMVMKSLHGDGYTGVRIGSGDDVFSEAEWVMQIDGGQAERNPNFNFIDTAARALAAKLGRTLAGKASRFTNLKLHVAPVNAVAERRVGWRAVIYQ
jgi:hypothetical protein